ncbi:hypothetical protein O6H91_05G044800 [Diphasiastrum complanatum]|uniref:Uncharacterized protein n=1 Tax=Diphasiastrum complanatum TaxID=34168 RepID=A0ACC2DMQ2_DIPCM|nr:hypothetical protein O6H91_05G044800 [Diphasiastrum complanatum]
MPEDRAAIFSGVNCTSGVTPTFGMPSQAAAMGNEARRRFHVDLSESNNVVSWKKLLQTMPSTNADAPAGANPALEAWLSPQMMKKVDALQVEKLPLPSHRFSSVIEKIEKLYQGKDSDEEITNEIPDDDRYNTDDSFIDDTELDEYFLVDRTKMKHTGFFINRGNLEKVSEEETPLVPTKKRNHRDLKKLSNENAQAAPQETEASGARKKSAAARKLLSSSGLKDGQDEKSHFHNLGKSSKLNIQMERSDKDRSSDLQGPHEQINIDLLKNRIKDHGHSFKFANKFIKGSQQPCDRKGTGLSYSDKVFQQKEKGTTKNGMVSLLPKKLKNHTECRNEGKGGSSRVEVNVISTEQCRQRDVRLASPIKVEVLQNILMGEKIQEKDGSTEKASAPKENIRMPLFGKDGSAVKRDGSVVKRLGLPKSTILEKSIQDLEQEVLKTCPPSSEGQDADKLSQSGVKSKRLPRDVKQKLAKVARIAGKQGKIPKELIDRLMSILGHVMQLKTLKRNLKEMVDLGLSVQQEKEGCLQDIKREVEQLVKSRVFSLQRQEAEQGDGSADDFQLALGSAEGVISVERFKWDHATEDRLCDLYEQYVEGMDEHKGSHIRKFYVELAELWPSGWMDNNGIKHAVYRAKGRKKRHSKLTQELRTESRKRRKVGEASKTVGQSAEGVLVKPSAIVKNVHLPFDREVRVASGNGQDLQENRGMYKHQKDRISQVDGKKDHSGRWAGQKVTSDKIKGETGPQLEHTVKTALIDPHRKMKKSSKSLLHSPKRRLTESSLSLHKSKKLEAFVLMPISEKENLLLPGGSLLRYASEELGPL